MEANVSKSTNKVMALVVVVALALVAAAVIAYDALLFKKMKDKAAEKGAEIILYNGGKDIKEATDRVVTVNGKKVFLYDTPVNLNRSWSRNPVLTTTPMGYFDFNGKVKIEVKAPGVDVKKVVVRPLSLGITPEINGDTISFEIDKPSKMTIEFNDEVARALHLFANEIEVNPPKKGDPNVIYYGPGVHKVGRINVKSGDTVYIAGGAVVYGCIVTNNLENIKITGHGIICGTVYDRWSETMLPLRIDNSKNITIEGITILDPSGWNIQLYKGENIKVNDVRIIAARSNSDGVSVQSCKNVTVTNCFVRTWDDCLVVKGYDGDSKNITFDNCILWTDLAQSMEVGYESRAEFMEEITFKNITVLHNFHKPIMSVHNGDNAMVRNIYFKDVIVEDSQMGQGDAGGNNYLVDLYVTYNSNWSRTTERGYIRNVYFENISVLGGTLPGSKIQCFDEKYNIENVFIKNMKIFGKDIKNAKDGGFYIDEFAKNINFE